MRGEAFCVELWFRRTRGEFFINLCDAWLLHRLLALARDLCEDQEVGGALYAIEGIAGRATDGLQVRTRLVAKAPVWRNGRRTGLKT